MLKPKINVRLKHVAQDRIRLVHVLEAAVVAKVKAMTRKEIILKAMEGKLTWVAAADILDRKSVV